MRTDKPKDAKEDAKYQETDQGGGHNGFHSVIFLSAKITTHQHSRTDAGTDCHTNKHIRKRRTGPDRRKCGGTDKLTDDDGIRHVIDLLKKATDNHRQCKNSQCLQGRLGD